MLTNKCFLQKNIFIRLRMHTAWEQRLYFFIKVATSNCFLFNIPSCISTHTCLSHNWLSLPKTQLSLIGRLPHRHHATFFYQLPFELELGTIQKWLQRLNDAYECFGNILDSHRCAMMHNYSWSQTVSQTIEDDSNVRCDQIRFSRARIQLQSVGCNGEV